MLCCLCYGAWNFIQTGRQAHYFQDVAQGSLFIIDQYLSRKESTEDAFQYLSTLFSAEMQAVPLDMLGGSAPVPEKPIIHYEEDRQVFTLTSYLSSNSVLSFKFGSCSASEFFKCLMFGTISLMIEEAKAQQMSLDDYIGPMAKKLGYRITMGEIQSYGLTEQARQLAIMENNLIYRLGKHEAVVLLPENKAQVLVISTPAFKKTSPLAVTFLLFFFSALIGLGLYQVVIVFETRLRKLQQATERLSQGYLNVRIHSRGEDPISRLGVSFNKMAEHIQHLISIQREMIRAVSHELRTPVARIRFAAQIMEDAVMEDAFLQKQLVGMDSDIQELDELIDEILTYAKLEEGGPILDFKSANVAAIAEQVVHEARSPSGVTVEYLGEDSTQFPESEIEPRYVHRAIQNLVGNAGRYAKSKVYVSCSLYDDICRVDVEDDGPGIPEEDWDRVFNAFARLDDSRTRSSGGYGLGLSIVKRIIYWHGGQSRVDKSDQLGGARFSLIWPRNHDA